jgi:hypothetical protein
MNKRLKILTLFICTYVYIYGCKTSYSPGPVSSSASYLVVEGTINTGADSTIIHLSHTVQLSSGIDSSVVTGAQVIVESSSNASYPLSEIGKGIYASANLGLDSTQQYRLHIKTSDGKEYLSDLVQSKPTPPIDSIGFTTSNNVLQLYVNTHDPKGVTRYYRWQYQETWQFHAKYFSSYYSNGSAIIPRTLDQIRYYCFQNHFSSSILLGSSAKLSQDVISQQPILSIPSTSEKIELKYSILLKQYALTKDAYNYWQNLKKNTEQLGSIFDAQPSEIQGNIHCISNPHEPVIGYISVGSVKQKRIFIDSGQLPLSWVPTYPYVCTQDSMWFCKLPSCINEVAQDLIPNPGAYQPTQQFYINGALEGYLASSPECTDCTLRGTQQTPAFWK